MVQRVLSRVPIPIESCIFMKYVLSRFNQEVATQILKFFIKEESKSMLAN